jgi:hypothetical protein
MKKPFDFSALTNVCITVLKHEPNQVHYHFYPRIAREGLVGRLVVLDLEGLAEKCRPQVAAACECGAAKASGAARGSPAHSAWCPWSKP